jgi:phosphomannomutase
VHDPRLIWNSIEQITAAGGVPVQSKSGHAFMKETMRRVDAVYGGELSAHHFFREFAYCDSGMIPWLLVVDRMSTTGKPLSELVGERMRRFPASGEINRRVDDQAGRHPPRARPLPHRGPAGWTRRTGSASSSLAGASTCAPRTPSP